MTRPFLAAVMVLLAFQPAWTAPDDPPWRKRYTLPQGFVLELDTEGYKFPTALAFVPKPGPEPGDPLYFVVELRGQVKVVTNDRTVHTFAEGFLTTEFTDAMPDGTAEFGAAGICLDPERGFVFVTFAYQDRDRLLRNEILRFETRPGTFGVRPATSTSLGAPLREFKSGVSHQIGPCRVEDGLLYVAVGDGFDAPQGSQRVDTLLGKILRMTLDGRPAPDNPFIDPLDSEAPAGFVWAYGLRNAFGMSFVDGHLLVADNGLSTDRFLEIRRGENYLWDGTERSMAINVPAVVSPSIGPVQMDHLPKASPLFADEYRDRLFLALSGRVPGIMTFDYDVKAGRMRSTPSYFMQHRGETRQMITGLAFGPDGLYFAPILPDADGRTAVYRVRHDPSSDVPGSLLENPNPWVLLYEKGCNGCHKLGDLIRGGTIGPPLDREGLLERLDRQLSSPEYLASLDEADKLAEEPQISFAKARKEVRAARGHDRIRTWIRYRIQEPRFDRVLSAMPNMGVSDAEAVRIADFLVGPAAPPRSKLLDLRALLPAEVGRRSAVGLFALGILLGGLVAVVVTRAVTRGRGR